MTIIVNDHAITEPDLAPLANDFQDLTEEELEALEDAEDLAIAKERYATMDRSKIIPAGTARSAS